MSGNRFHSYFKSSKTDRSSMRWFILSLLLFYNGYLASGTASGNVDSRCYPGRACFPLDQELIRFQRGLNGTVLYPSDDLYHKVVLMKNTVVTKFPVAIVAPSTTEEVQKSILFARKHNLRVTIQSSGHDYNGRSTGHGSLQIHLGSMKKTHVNLNSNRNPAGEITCESGNSWINVYTEVDKYNRVIIGGSAQTVSMGGYTLGGGHSPMSRMFGLAVDNLLEAKMVDSYGNIVIANNDFTHITYVNGSITNSTNTDIFWALRGGGGGTYGIVTEFTFKLHHPAPQVVEFYCLYPIFKAGGQKVGFDVIRKFADLLVGLPKQWGGYFSVSDKINADFSRGNIAMFMNHYGEYNSDTRAYMDQMKEFHPEWQLYCSYFNFSTFLQYETLVKDGLYYSNYIVNSLLQNTSFTDEWINFIIDSALVNDPNDPSTGSSMTGTLLGGTMMDVGIHDTAVHPGFRSALMSLTMGKNLNISARTFDATVEATIRMGNELEKFGDGMYPNESGADVPNWKTEFWGSNYQRLIDIKMKWDPDNFLTCRECVGSDLSGINAQRTHGSHATNQNPQIGLPAGFGK